MENKSNQELDKIVKHKNTINFVKGQTLEWYGHIKGMQEGRMVKAIHSWNPISIGQTGWPKILCENDVRKYLQRINAPNWKTLVQDRKKYLTKWVRRPKLCIKGFRPVPVAVLSKA